MGFPVGRKHTTHASWRASPSVSHRVVDVSIEDTRPCGAMIAISAINAPLVSFLSSKLGFVGSTNLSRIGKLLPRYLFVDQLL